MNKQIAIREIKVYQSDDGRKIEEHKITTTVNPPESIDEEYWEHVKDIADKDVLYFGSMLIETSMGNSEVKFHIEGAENLQDAYGKIDAEAEKAMTKIQKEMEQQQNQIVTAAPNDMDILNSITNDTSGIITN
tara:strand:- start:62 stop:460 length:399 start_codon:yes stop_codon:yes gene_type:complete